MAQARADVATDAPARYAKQLLSHLGHRAEVRHDGEGGEGGEIVFTAGRGVVRVGDGVLTLLASAPDEEGLARVTDVLGRHLERFGARNELVVTWRDGEE